MNPAIRSVQHKIYEKPDADETMIGRDVIFRIFIKIHDFSRRDENEEHMMFSHADHFHYVRFSLPISIFLIANWQPHMKHIKASRDNFCRSFQFDEQRQSIQEPNKYTT